jgi:hypothetical protein
MLELDFFHAIVRLYRIEVRSDRCYSRGFDYIFDKRIVVRMVENYIGQGGAYGRSQLPIVPNR